MSDCPFCLIWGGNAPAQSVFQSHDTMGIVPLNPVTSGHVIFFPREHRIDALHDPDVTGRVFSTAARWADANLARGEACNLITSAGEYATQTVLHLHVHVVPRRLNDGLLLPWSPKLPWSPIDPVIARATKLLLEEGERMAQALEEIVVMAERSDAHPDLQFGPIARRGLGMSE